MIKRHLGHPDVRIDTVDTIYDESMIKSSVDTVDTVDTIYDESMIKSSVDTVDTVDTIYDESMIKSSDSVHQIIFYFTQNL